MRTHRVALSSGSAVHTVGMERYVVNLQLFVDVSSLSDLVVRLRDQEDDNQAAPEDLDWPTPPDMASALSAVFGENLGLLDALAGIDLRGAEIVGFHTAPEMIEPVQRRDYEASITNKMNGRTLPMQ